MSESLPLPDASRFPALDADRRWVREIPAGTALFRIFRPEGPHPAEWFAFRDFGPLDARFDPHPEPTAEHPGCGVMYAVVEGGSAADSATDTHEAGVSEAGASETQPAAAGMRSDDPPQESAPDSPLGSALDSAFAACLLEVFQQHRIIRRSAGSPTLVAFEIARPLRLLDLSDSDWITVAGGNAAISSGERSRARAWARAIRTAYPGLDGVLAASSLVPTARVAALWEPARNALPRHPLALLRLDREELDAVINAIAERYGYVLL